MTDRTRTPRPRRTRLLRAALGSGALATALLAAGAGVASAHVTVSAPEATPGGSDAVITFRVPDESESARTVGLKVRLPTDTPIASVLVQPKTGWSVTVSQAKLATPIKTDDGEVTEAVSEIDWKVTAGGPGIAPGQFDEFSFIAGQLPDAKTLTFKAVQAYSDGSTTSWIEEPAPGSSAEPEHPAPVLTLAAGSGSSSSGPPDGSGSSGGSSEPASPSVSASASDASNAAAEAANPDDAASKASAVTGIVLGALGVLLGLAALVLALRRHAT
ncbi:YcnI family protein [Jatrophihabitans sp.]|uniref:YcnI family protein n=1 Tax=Jatrophihabitans sp. TaxID=1932789 RepID=UPI002BE73377|nr:YcnI family protein [Jatrophihabitans sp.]